MNMYVNNLKQTIKIREYIYIVLFQLILQFLLFVSSYLHTYS